MSISNASDAVHSNIHNSTSNIYISDILNKVYWLDVAGHMICASHMTCRSPDHVTVYISHDPPCTIFVSDVICVSLSDSDSVLQGLFC